MLTHVIIIHRVPCDPGWAQSPKSIPVKPTLFTLPAEALYWLPDAHLPVLPFYQGGSECDTAGSVT